MKSAVSPWGRLGSIPDSTPSTETVNTMVSSTVASVLSTVAVTETADAVPAVPSTMLNRDKDRIIKECPKYENFSNHELNTSFNRIMEEELNDLKTSDYYDFDYTNSRLDYIFSNRKNLYKFYKENTEQI